MSMSVDVDVHAQDGDVLPAALPSKSLLATDAYAKQLHDADAVIEDIIVNNLPKSRQA